MAVHHLAELIAAAVNSAPLIEQFDLIDATQL
jgi:hypothetical protein